MNPPTPHDPELQRVQELLPFHAVGALPDDERLFVERWLAQQGATHPQLLAELDWLRVTAALARENAQELQAEAGLGELMARIRSERAPAPPVVVRRSWLDWLSPRRPALAFALGAVVLAQAVVIGSMLGRDGAEQVPLSGGVVAPSSDVVVFTLSFRAGTSEAAMRALAPRVRLRC
jgi:hypothetical protein